MMLIDTACRLLLICCRMRYYAVVTLISFRALCCFVMRAADAATLRALRLRYAAAILMADVAA